MSLAIFEISRLLSEYIPELIVKKTKIINMWEFQSLSRIED